MSTDHIAEARFRLEKKLCGSLTFSSLEALARAVVFGDPYDVSDDDPAVSAFDNNKAAAIIGTPVGDAVYVAAKDDAVATRVATLDGTFESNGRSIPSQNVENNVDSTVYAVNSGDEPPNILDPEADSEAEGTMDGITPSSPISTRIFEKEVAEMQVFETTPTTEVVAGDYVHGGTYSTPASCIFAILPIYVWFLYLRDNVLALKPYIHLHRNTSAFMGCDVVLLVHFNWVSIEDCFWMDARHALGTGLLLLYGKPLHYELAPGAVRPTPHAPVVRHYHEKFSSSKLIELFREKSTARMYKQSLDDIDRKIYGHFGEAVYNCFSVQERPKLEEMYEHLCGRGPMPKCSDGMKRLFAPILHCRNGGVGGHGEPYEVPREDDFRVMVGTEKRGNNAETELGMFENAPISPFCLLRQQAGGGSRRACVLCAEKAQRRNEEEPQIKAARDDCKCKMGKQADDNNSKGKTDDRDKGNTASFIPPGDADRAATGSISDDESRALRPDSALEPRSSLHRAAVQFSRSFSRAEKGKWKAINPPPNPDSDSAETGSKRTHENDEDVGGTTDVGVIQHFSDPGPSCRPIRRTRRKVEVIGPRAVPQT